MYLKLDALPFLDPGFSLDTLLIAVSWLVGGVHIWGGKEDGDWVEKKRSNIYGGYI